MPSADLAGTVIPHQANTDVDRQANRAQTTMDCFSASLSGWPLTQEGRMCTGFQADFRCRAGLLLAGYSVTDLAPDTKGGHPIPMQQKTDKQLETARVAIYPVDARGVAAPDMPA